MATIESNAVKKEDVSRETSEEKPVEVELPLETVEKTEEKPQEKSLVTSSPIRTSKIYAGRPPTSPIPEALI